MNSWWQLPPCPPSPFGFFLLPAPLALSCHLNQENTEQLIDKQTQSIWVSPKHSSVLSVVSCFASLVFMPAPSSPRHGMVVRVRKLLLALIYKLISSLLPVLSLLRQRNVGGLDQSFLEGNRRFFSCFAIDRRFAGKDGVDRYGYCLLA